MAILSKIINGSLTEIYVNGGGNFMTQACPTYFHNFWTRKILSAGESVTDFMEVTPEEKTVLERSDATFQEPTRALIDRCKANDIVYNEKTGYFEFNGLIDLTIDDINVTLDAGAFQGYYGREWYTRNGKLRTNLPCRGAYSWPSTEFAFLQCNNLEVANMQYAVFSQYTFAYCQKLRRIVGNLTRTISTQNANINMCFYQCYNLEDIEMFSLHNVKTLEVDFGDSPKLSLGTFRRSVESANISENILFIVHPDVYAKLTDDSNTQWNKILTDAADKNIFFATT